MYDLRGHESLFYCKFAIKHLLIHVFIQKTVIKQLTDTTDHTVLIQCSNSCKIVCDSCLIGKIIYANEVHLCMFFSHS